MKNKLQILLLGMSLATTTTTFTASTCLAKIFCCTRSSRSSAHTLTSVCVRPLELAPLRQPMPLQSVTLAGNIQAPVQPLLQEHKDLHETHVPSENHSTSSTVVASHAPELSAADNAAHMLNNLLLPPLASLVVEYCQCYWVVHLKRNKFTVIEPYSGIAHKKSIITSPDGTTCKVAEAPSNIPSINNYQWLFLWCYDLIAGFGNQKHGGETYHDAMPHDTTGKLYAWSAPNTLCDVEVTDTNIVARVFSSLGTPYDGENLNQLDRARAIIERVFSSLENPDTTFEDHARMVALAQAHKKILQTLEKAKASDRPEGQEESKPSTVK